MKEPSQRPRLRGVPLLVARVAALALSLGVVALVTMNAGLGGCRPAAPAIEAESPDEDPKPAAAAPRASQSAAASDDEDDERFMGGAKAPAGAWARPHKRSKAPDEQAPGAKAPGGNQ